MNNLKSRIVGEAGFWARKALHRERPVLASSRRLSEEWRRMAKPDPSGLPAPKSGKRILFVTGNGLNALSLSVESLLCKSLALRGHDCHALICNRGLPSCEFNIGGSGSLDAGKFSHGITPPGKDRVCRDCSLSASLVMGSAGAEVHGLNTFGPGRIDDIRAIAEKVEPKDIKAYVYKGIHVGDHAFSSTLRITLRGVVDVEDPDEAWIFRRQLISAMVMVDRLNAALDKLRPDKVVATHGVYLTHGVMADVCEQRGIDVVIYGIPYRKGTVWLSHKETYHKSLVSDPISNWRDLKLTPEKERILGEYLASKTAGGRDNVNYHPNPITEREKIVRSMGLDPALPVIGMFTNVIWDAQIYYQFNAFENIFDWIFSTIEYFRTRPDLQLAIRIHPAETKGGFTTSQPMAPEIAKRFPDLPKNVFVIPAESDISSYTIAEMSLATLIYGTKMGLEIALRGVPVIVAGETFNRRKGFTYDVETREQYFRILDGVKDMPPNSEEMISNVKKFSYYLFFQRMIDMPLLNKNLHGSFRKEGETFFNFRGIDSLRQGKDRGLDVICEGIATGSPFILPD